jgi:DNA-binding XRE family transcriptional regulator
MKESTIAKGRVGVYCPDHLAANNRGYVLRSRIVMEAYLGRDLSSSEHVHHKNGNKLDDRIENLEILSRKEHTKEHWKNYSKRLYESRVRGEAHHLAKLTFGKVVKIRKLYSKGVTQRKLAEMYGVSRRTIRSVLKKRTWKHVM